MVQTTISFLLIGAIALSIIQVCQIDIAYVMLFDMWSKSVKHTFMAPVRGFHLIIGSLLFGILRSTLVFVILMILSFYFFSFDFLVAGVWPTMVFLGGLFLTSASIGYLSAFQFSGSDSVLRW